MKKTLTKAQQREIAAIAVKKDADIDLSDMPEILDWSQATVGQFYRLAKDNAKICPALCHTQQLS